MPGIPSLLIRPPADCRDCRQSRTYYSWCRSAGFYEGPWRRAILAFKRESRSELTWQMAAVLRRLLRRELLPLGPWDGLVPIPGRFRPKAHAAVRLAQCLAKLAGLRCFPRLRYIRPTRPQSGLSRELRLKNMRRCMQAAACRRLRLIVVDDVYTTGSTAREASRALLAAGAERVAVLTLARAERPVMR